MAIYVETRIFRWDPLEDGSFPQTPGLVDSHAAQFANIHNATVAFERTKKPLVDAVESGVTEMTDALRPGPRRKGRDLGVTT